MIGLAVFGGLMGLLILYGSRASAKKKSLIEQATFFELMSEANNALMKEDRVLFCAALSTARTRLDETPKGPAVDMPVDILQQYQLAIMVEQSGIGTDQMLSIAGLLEANGYDYEAHEVLHTVSQLHDCH
jgi:hypothetical protein